MRAKCIEAWIPMTRFLLRRVGQTHRCIKSEFFVQRGCLGRVYRTIASEKTAQNQASADDVLLSASVIAGSLTCGNTQIANQAVSRQLQFDSHLASRSDLHLKKRKLVSHCILCHPDSGPGMCKSTCRLLSSRCPTKCQSLLCNHWKRFVFAPDPNPVARRQELVVAPPYAICNQ